VWTVISVCQWLSFAPGPVPAAGMTRVAACAATGSAAMAAAVMNFLSFMMPP
jgi:hypothetical protein